MPQFYIKEVETTEEAGIFLTSFPVQLENVFLILILLKKDVLLDDYVYIGHYSVPALSTIYETLLNTSEASANWPTL